MPKQCIKTNSPPKLQSARHHSNLLDGDRLGQVSGEIHVQSFSNRKPVGHELERNDVEETLQNVNLLRDLDLVRLVARELLVVSVANDDWATLAGNDLLVGVE